MSLERKTKEQLLLDELVQYTFVPLKSTFFLYNQTQKDFQLAQQQLASKLYVDNILLKQNLKIVSKEQEYLKSGRDKLFQTTKSFNKQSMQCQKKRRNRRNAYQINRLYQCEIKGCEKSYGSQGTLAQHYRTKHPQILFEKQESIDESNESIQK